MLITTTNPLTLKKKHIYVQNAFNYVNYKNVNFTFGNYPQPTSHISPVRQLITEVAQLINILSIFHLFTVFKIIFVT